ncbi:85/88 kDa calcium-independent phospholipase A2-like [Thrips palmi]|uniref:phospholipase A2 n=1 Tax=Thrips palmi TaxID=161013 RepID=A0A6P8Z4M9_THRPL|nr:85/88 kDa calcium-independent phospholipase A2-like [Thrips palmi]XP_034245060.1 85/88 kDa calcium-independent phospholipase A2-like [Thrips palmi]
MSEWWDGLEKLAPGTGGLIRNILSPESIPNKVLEVKLDRYTKRVVQRREENLVLYGPAEKKYEVVLAPALESASKGFSLYRVESTDNAEKRFDQLKDKLPVIFGVSKEECNVTMIQKVCDGLENNPGWNIAHLAAYCDLISALNSDAVSEFLDKADPNTGMTPLLVAIQAQNVQAIKTLIGKKISLDCVDNEANSVLHYAASTSKEILTLLTDVYLKCLNDHNAKGHTPLHVACLADKPECVKALMVAGADCNISAATEKYSENDTSPKEPGILGNLVQEFSSKLHAQDMKFGGTPLHWSCSREVVESLLEKKCHINALNFDGRSALHLMVMRKRLDCIMALLSHGADLNIGDCDGNTPLHFAVTNRNLTAVQALIVFGASLNYKNNNGATARHLATKDTSSDGNKILYLLHSVGAARCSQDMKECTSGCSFTGKFNGTAPPSPYAIYAREALDQILATNAMDIASHRNGDKSSRIRSHALCLDGGGIKGVVLVIMLREIEQAVGKPIIKCFDWVSGTSTGGILALALAVGKSLQDCLCLYFRMKDSAFLGNRPYPNEPLEKILKDCFGADTVMSEITHPKLMITGLLADRKPVDLHLFRNYESPLQILGKDEYSHGKFKKPVSYHEQFLWEAARASGAAPTYFGAHGFFLDGGLIANNPSLDCLTEIHEYNMALKAVGRESELAPITALVSIGTGNIPTTELQDIDVGRPGSLWNATKLVSGVSNLITLIIDQATQSSGRVVDRARSWCSSLGVPFYRFTPQLSEDINMDERSDEKLVNMAWECQAYMHSQRTVVNELAEILRG